MKIARQFYTQRRRNRESSMACAPTCSLFNTHSMHIDLHSTRINLHSTRNIERPSALKQDGAR
ncbi:MAG TPA: hypothetical protein VGC89_18495 [Pyrinomonadaceae bacterium]